MRIKEQKTQDDFRYMEQLELKYYSEEHVTPWEEAYRWHLANPKTGFVLEDGGRIAGFSDILPLDRALTDQILQGTYDDKYLTAEDLISMEELQPGTRVDLLLSCIVIDDDYRQTDALKILLNAHLDYYRQFSEKGIFIHRVVTSNVTKAGEGFSERMGFMRVGTSAHHTAIYRTTFEEFDHQVRNIKRRTGGMYD